MTVYSFPGGSPSQMEELRPKRDTDAAAIRGLLQWYRKHKRDLPWRRTQDPYRIWISEIMLQQTRVAAVIPYYERFLALFPDVPRWRRPPSRNCWRLGPDWDIIRARAIYRRPRAPSSSCRGFRAIMPRCASCRASAITRRRRWPASRSGCRTRCWMETFCAC